MQNILSHINMGNAPDVIGRGSDSAPYFMSSSTKDMTRTWKTGIPMPKHLTLPNQEAIL